MNDKFEYSQISEAYSQIKEDMRGLFDDLQEYGKPIGDYIPDDNLVKILFLEGGLYIVCIYRSNIVDKTGKGQFLGKVIKMPNGQQVAEVVIRPEDIGF